MEKQVHSLENWVIVRTLVNSVHLMFLFVYVDCFVQISLQVVCPGDFSYLIHNKTTMAIFVCFFSYSLLCKDEMKWCKLSSMISRELKCLHAFIKFVKLVTSLHVGTVVSLVFSMSYKVTLMNELSAFLMQRQRKGERRGQ